MKKLSILLLITLLLSCNNVSKQKISEAKIFHKKIGTYYTPAINNFNTILSHIKDFTIKSIEGTIDSSDIKQINIEIENLILEIDEKKDSINNLKEFDKNIKLKEVALINLTNIKDILQNDFNNYIVLIQNGINEENRDKGGEILLQIYDKTNILERNIQEIDDKFVKKYK